MPSSQLGALVLSASILLSACGGSSGGGDKAPTPDKTPDTPSPQAPDTFKAQRDSVFKTTVLAAGNCPNGGVQIEMGIDTNGNGVLDTAEIDSSRTQMVCHGQNGGTAPVTLFNVSEPTTEECEHGGTKVSIGQDSNQDGTLAADEIVRSELLCNAIVTIQQPASLIRTENEAAGNNCSNGGIKVLAGLDKNSNLSLDSDEVQSTSYVCSGINGTNGTDGKDGVDGKDGADGTNGTNGTDGADGNNGYTSLIKTLPEPAGENCSNGGTKVVSGIDNNQNQQLDDNEISATSYVCNGQNGTNGTNGEDGIDGQNGDGALAGKLLINTEQEPFGSNCLHGGHEHSIGLDKNSDNILQDEEITSRSYSCNNNSAPTITFSDNLRAVPGYEFNLAVTSEDFSEYGQDAVQISITEKPDWLTVAGQGSNTLRLSGIAVGNPGDTFTVTVQSTDTELTTQSSIEISLVEGVYISIEANDIVEGNQDESNPYGRTESSFKLKLSSALEDDLRITGNLFNIYTSSYLQVKNDDYYGSTFFEGTFAAGETEKTIEIALNADNQYELAEGFIIVLNNIYYEGDKEVLHPAFAEVNIINDDPELLTFQSDQSNSIQIAFARLINNESSTELVNAPEWLEFNEDSYQQCDYHHNYTCYYTTTYKFMGTPSAAEIGKTYIFTARINLPERIVEKEVTLTVVEGDFDYDGVLNSADAFPEDSRYQSDEDNDGLADKWELNYFGDLTSTDGSGDADGDSISDANEFINQTPPAPDVDNDGVADALDAYPNDSRYKIDSDNDGIADRWEQNQFSSLDIVDENSDFDRDGFSDLNEFLTNSNPQYADTDSDGLSDGEDAFPTNSSYKTDSDNDGLADEWELTYFSSLEEANAETDSDSDGISDIDEFKAGTLAAVDSDSDGTVDISDAFPNNALYTTDSDNDGIADKWEREKYGYSYANLHYFSETGDYDSDGLTDKEEFINGTEPTFFDGELVFKSGENNSVIYYNSPGQHRGPGFTGEVPDWLGHDCPSTTCRSISLTGTPTEEEVGETGSFDIILSSVVRTVTYRVEEGDTDRDGVLNSADAFPTIASAHTDSDEDGLGDEWEMANFESLELADGTTDFDNNGVTDQQAFENGTPINDLTFDFESGELPNGWVNSGDINWVVTDAHSYQGDYALTIEQPLAPGEEATITFTANTQSGAMELYSRVIEYQTGSYELQLRKNNSFTNHLNTESYWWSSSTNFEAGSYSLQLRYKNRSSTHNAPKIYVDDIRGLVGWIPADRDGDGVLNNVDLYPDRSDAATDSDNDGIGDEWEMRYFGTLDRVDATTDHDNDGLLDVHEFSLKANPTSRYTDGDGVADGDDAFPAQPEYQSDTDNDGLADKWELVHFGSLETSDGTQDSDSDGASDLAEFEAQTPPTPDRDNDGAADVVDAFPDNPEYKLDSDNDGIADEWEKQYGYTSRYSDTSDYDGDGRNDLTEFLAGTDPNEKNLNAVEDIFALAKGETITLNLTANDISQEENITVVSVTAPAPGLGTVTENADGSFSYTASDNYLGWVNFSYTANDGVSDSTGEIFVRITAETPPNVVKVDGGSNYSMALFSDGSLYSWGNNSYGQLGHGDTENRPVPTQITGISDVKDFDLSERKAIALTNSEEAWLWGSSQSTPNKLAHTGVKAISIEERGYGNYYLLTSDGTVSQGNSIISGDLTQIVQIAAGTNHLLMLDNNGDVWALGNNYYGQLGNGSNADSNTPIVVSKLSNIRSIEAGHYQSFAIDNNGDLFAWGYNGSSQLGDGTTTNRNVPVQITSLSDVQSVSAGYDHTLVLLENGQLYGMGYNTNGELNSSSSYSTYRAPRLIAEDIRLMGTGHYTSFMVNNQNLAFGFGRNTNGQLGDGTTQNRYTPTEISWLQEGVVSELGKESFEWGRIPPYWRNSGSNWEAVNNQSVDGSYSVRVKDRLNDYESASLGFQVTTAAGDMTFKVKTSTEANHDILKFKIDGVEQDLSVYHSSGENDWGTSATFTLEAGLHSFEWVYAKDGGTSEGDDTVWLDDIRLPLDSDGDGSLDHIDTEPYNAAVQ